MAERTWRERKVYTMPSFAGKLPATSVVVAHRLSTIQRADNIIVLHHGEIREQGSHQDLLTLHGLYWKLYKLQYSDPSRLTQMEEEEEQPVSYKPRGSSFSFSDGMG